MTAEPSWTDSADTGSADSQSTEVFDAIVVEDGNPADWFSPPGNGNGKLRSVRSDPNDHQPLDRDASTGIPKIGEWENFFGNIIIRLATDFYIDLAFREIDEDLLSDREVERIKLDKNERLRIARPFAEYSNKSKFMRKHGRMIIASGDSIDAFIQLGMWFSRVNRIARKYKGTHRKTEPKLVRAAPVFTEPQGRHHPPPVQQPVPHAPQAGEAASVSFGQSEKPPDTIRPPGWRPDIEGLVYNPGG